MLIIDKHYEGLKYIGKGWYRYEGNIVTKDDIKISRMSLEVTGYILGNSIKSTRSIKAYYGIEVKKDVDVNGDLISDRGGIFGDRINVGGSIEAEKDIKASRDIIATGHITAKWSIIANYKVESVEYITAGNNIIGYPAVFAPGDIKAGDMIYCNRIETNADIQSGHSIISSLYIKAGGNITSGLGIEAGYDIEGNIIKAALHIEAGLMPLKYKEYGGNRIGTITAKEVTGTILYGKYIEKK